MFTSLLQTQIGLVTYKTTASNEINLSASVTSAALEQRIKNLQIEAPAAGSSEDTRLSSGLKRQNIAEYFTKFTIFTL